MDDNNNIDSMKITGRVCPIVCRMEHCFYCTVTSESLYVYCSVLNVSIQVMSVGIGSSITQTELDNIATDKQHVFAVANFDLLNTLQNELESLACKT